MPTFPFTSRLSPLARASVDNLVLQQNLSMRWSLATVALVPRGSTAHADQPERRRIFDWAAAAGFEGVEISPQWLNLAELTDSELAEVRNQASACGLVISGLNCNRILRRNTASLSQPSLAHRALDAAAILGSEVVTLSLSLPLGGPSRPNSPGPRRSARRRRLTCWSGVHAAHRLPGHPQRQFQHRLHAGWYHAARRLGRALDGDSTIICFKPLTFP